MDEETGIPRAVSRPVLEYVARTNDAARQAEGPQHGLGGGPGLEQPGPSVGEDDPDRDFGHLESELKQEQLETDTHPHQALDDLEKELRSRRRQADEAARSQGARIAALATSPVAVVPHTTRDPRYQAMAEHFGLTTTEQLACGLHVHVSIDSAEESVAVLDRIRVWLPALLALSANSPYWQGTDTGYASFRNQALQRWPGSGPTDVYDTPEAYQEMVAAHIATGVLLDDSMVYADARISAHYPTVEVRVADVCLDVVDSTLIGGLARGLVETAVREWKAGEQSPAVPTMTVRLATWRAARSAVHGPLLHPSTCRPLPAREVIDLLLEHVRPALRDLGDEEWVENALELFWNRGNGARSQRAAWERSKDGAAVVRAAVERTIG